jgi:hypothetical protein
VLDAPGVCAGSPPVTPISQRLSPCQLPSPGRHREVLVVLLCLYWFLNVQGDATQGI